VAIGVTRLEAHVAHVAPDNHASRGVAEGTGFSPQDVFDDDTGQVMVRYVRPGAERGSPGRRACRPAAAGKQGASLIAWLLGPDGGWMTGQILSPNGGVGLGR